MSIISSRTRYGLPAGSAVRDFFEKHGAESLIPFLAMCLLFGVFAITVPNYLTVLNLQQLMSDYSIPAFLAMAMAVTVFAGCIDLSIGATFAIANFVALFLVRVHGWPFAGAGLCVLGVGLAIGTLNGMLVAYAKTRPFLTTLATLLILRAIYDREADRYTAELADASYTGPTWEFLGAGKIFGIPASIIALIVTGLALHVFLTRMRPGIHVMAVGASRKAARHAGIAVNRVLFLAYVISGVTTAVAGIFYAARNDSAGSDTGLGWEVTALAAVVLGGARLSGGSGTIPRVLIGSSITFLLVSGLLRMNAPGSLTSGLIGLVLLSAVGLSARVAEARKLSGH
jgi:ribose transport system permease protein